MPKFIPREEAVLFLFNVLRRASILTGILLLLLPPPTSAANLEPTGLQDAHLLKKNAAEIRLGVSYAYKLRLPFQIKDKDRRLAEIPALTLNLGLGDRVEGQLYYNFLNLKEDGQKDGWSSGDLIVAFKVGLFREGPRLPALALRFATKLPDANRPRHFGTDQTDYFVDLLGAKSWGGVSLYANLGFGILGNPGIYADDEQDDILRYGVGMKVPLVGETTRLLLSAEGIALCRPYTHNKRGAIQAGIQQSLGWGSLDFGGSVGYVTGSEDWSLRTGVTVPFSLSSY
jgi:hypothetical protein